MQRRTYLTGVAGIGFGLGLAGCVGGGNGDGDGDGNGDGDGTGTGDGSGDGDGNGDGDGDAPDPSTQPTDAEFEAVQSFAIEAILALEWTETVFGAVVDEEASVEDVETARGDLETALDEFAPDLPERSTIEAWDFNLQNDGESWSVDGEELARVIADLETLTGDALSVVEDVIAALEADGIDADVTEEMLRIIEEIQALTPEARSILFNQDS